MMKSVGPARAQILCLVLGMVASGVVAAFGMSMGSAPRDSTRARGMPPDFGMPGNPGLERNRGQHTFSYQVHRSSSPNGYSISYSSSQNGIQSPPQTYSFSTTRNNSPAPFQSYRPAATPTHISAARDFPGMMQYPMAAPRGGASPWIETELSEAGPFVDQPVIYTVRVVSTTNIKTLDPILPRTGGVVIEELEGPVTRSRTRAGGSPEIVNEYRFTFTPIKSGTVNVPPIQMKGTMAAAQPWYNAPGLGNAQPGGSGQGFSVSSGKPVTLEVKSAKGAVQPWLPLDALQIKGQLDSNSSIKEGQPVSLTVELSAVGAAGDQLPSIESQLKGADVRVYRESSRTERELSGDKMSLVGRRIETYTLVPLHGGDLHLPVLRVAWWNTGADKVETTTLALDGLGVSGSVESSGVYASPPVFPRADSSAAFWIPLTTFLGALFGYWSWAWYHARRRTRGRLLPSIGKLMQPLQPVAARLGGQLGRLPQLVSLAGVQQRVRYWLVMAMPAPMKLWFCSRCIQQESNPTEWCKMFKFLACKHLQVPHQTPLQDIGDRIVDVHRGTRPERVHAMLEELDGAMYGDKPLDFEVWKKAFRRELRPRLFGRRKRASLSDRGLPALNP
jgi:hypothetical protein